MPSRTPSFRLVKSSQLPRRLRRGIGVLALPFGLLLILPATLMGLGIAWDLGTSLLVRLFGTPNTAVGYRSGLFTGLTLEDCVLPTLFWALGVLIVFDAVRDILCWRHEDTAAQEPSDFERHSQPLRAAHPDR